MPEHLKTPLLRHLLRHTDMPSVLVFTRTKQGAKRLSRTIAADGFTVGELHSNLTQPQRNRAMEAFRKGDVQILVATNIAARGLDVDHITHVISVDVPTVPEDYVHRIGRTGRMEAEGDAFLLVAPPEEKNADADRAPDRPAAAARHAAGLRLRPGGPGPSAAGEERAEGEGAVREIARWRTRRAAAPALNESIRATRVSVKPLVYCNHPLVTH